jgi:hypothetical protein
MPNNRTRQSHVHFVITSVTTDPDFSLLCRLAMSTVTWSAASHESNIGPPSELIHIGDFLREAHDNVAHTSIAVSLSQQAAGGVDLVPQDDVASECRLVSL